MEQYNDEREARKRYIRHRQRVVFSVVGAVMAVALVVSMLFYFHVFGLGRVGTPVQAPNYGVTAPCSAKSEDGTPATTVDNPSITIRVLNGTSFSGFAQAVAKGLENRGFTVQGYDTLRDNNNAGEGFVTTVERTTIYFGRNAINQAYTLNDNFTDAIMVMDDREDALIDVVLGATFKNLKDTDEVLAPGSPIEDIEGCQPADQMTDLPAALAH